MASLAPAEKAPAGKPLKVGSPHDPAEREADRIAEILTAPEEPAMPVCAACAAGGAPCAACGGDGGGVLRRQVTGGASAAASGGEMVAPPSVLRAIQQPGRALDQAVQHQMEGRFGADFSGVRVHTDDAAAQSAADVNALAYTVSSNVVFGAGQYAPHSDPGQRLLAHELVHTLQQQGDDARVQRFEARLHESVERYSLTRGGFSQDEAAAVYYGNWMRDINQALVPSLAGLIGPDAVFAITSYLAFKHFGMSPPPEAFGYYIPSEHIDNPAGLVAQYDLMAGQPAISQPGTHSVPARPSQYVTPKEDVSPTTGTVQGANIFSVDQTGVMAYIRRTNLHVERRLELAARRRRSPEGMMHFGAALHAVEDLFAHSNWIEIAVSKVLADNPTMLPQLSGAERQAFTYSPTAQIGEGTRPVLTTGTFTLSDTMLSIGSELVTVLNTPLAQPSTDAQATAEQRLTYEMLRALNQVMQRSPQFRTAIRQALADNLPDIPGRDALLDRVLLLPLHEIYDVANSLLPHIPRAVRDFVGITAIQRAIRQAISQHAMQPAARAVQAMGIEASVADTPLINEIPANERRARGQFEPAELEMQRRRAQLTGRSVAQIQADAQAEATARVAALRATPEAMLAGPSHSQLAKDHVDSPFFGLAFRLAADAVQRLRDRMLAAWTAEAGGTDPGPHTFPGRPSDPAAAALYDERADAARESSALGRGIIARGSGIPAGQISVDAMRQGSVSQVDAVATALRDIANAPNQVSQGAQIVAQSQALRQLVGSQRTLLGMVQALQRAAAGVAAAAGTIDTSALRRLSDDLGHISNQINTATTHPQREAAHQDLIAARRDAFRVLAANPGLDPILRASILVILDRQIQATAVAYTTRQRAILEGRQHIGGSPAPPTTLQQSTVTLPSLASQPAHIRDMLQTSRNLITHPYEHNWWVTLVTNFIQQHPDQIANEIRARNLGYAVFRDTTRGSGGGGHRHP